MLDSVYQSYLTCAKTLKNFKEGTKKECKDITELANGYCDADEAGNESLRSAYFSALMIRYWYMISFLKKSVGDSRVSLDEILNWICDGLMIGFFYRRWRDKKHPLSKDKHGPEKVFHRAMETMKNRWYTYNNRQARKINLWTYSLEESMDIHGDSAEGCCVEDDTANTLSIDILVQTLLKKHKVFEALVVDNICYGDVWSNSKRSITSMFSNKKLYNALVTIDEKYVKYFTVKYDIKDSSEIVLAVTRVKNMSTRDAYKKIKASLEYFRKQKSIRQ